MKENKKHMFLAKYGDIEHISDALKSSNYDVRATAINNNNITKEHISQVLNSNSNEMPYVRQRAVSHKKATVEHISQVLNNSDEYLHVRRAAIENPNATIAHMNQVLDNPNEHYTVHNAAEARLKELQAK